MDNCEAQSHNDCSKIKVEVELLQKSIVKNNDAVVHESEQNIVKKTPRVKRSTVKKAKETPVGDLFKNKRIEHLADATKKLRQVGGYVYQDRNIDEYQAFANYVVASLQLLPMAKALIAQHEILGVLMKHSVLSADTQLNNNYNRGWSPNASCSYASNSTHPSTASDLDDKEVQDDLDRQNRALEECNEENGPLEAPLPLQVEIVENTVKLEPEDNEGIEGCLEEDHDPTNPNQNAQPLQTEDQNVVAQNQQPETMVVPVKLEVEDCADEEMTDWPDPSNYLQTELEVQDNENSFNRRSKKDDQMKQSYTCGACPYTSDKKSNMMRHKTQHAETYNCSQCAFVTSDIKDFGKHTKMHSMDDISPEETIYKCPLCPHITTRKLCLAKHINTHLRQKNWSCEKCDYVANTSNGFAEHMKEHSGDKPYACTLCPFTAKMKNHLIIHMRRHLQDKPYACNQCSYAAAESFALKTHMKRHTGERPYKCNECNFASVEKSKLKKHMRTHSTDRLYSCNQCSFTTIRSANFSAHVRTHSGGRFYSCTVCSYAAQEKNHLAIHMRTHTGEKPFKCDQCSFAAAQKSKLTIHMRTHTGERPYSCVQCSFTATTANSVTRHMRKAHWIGANSVGLE